jgi:hypothetical protein
MDIAFRANKILKRQNSYRAMDADLLSSIGQLLPLLPGETCIGIYENTLGELSDSILITNKGLHVFYDNDPRFIAFDNIEDVKCPSDKVNGDALSVKLTDNTLLSVPVRNGRGRFRDVFEFGRFVMRASGH